MISRIIRNYKVEASSSIGGADSMSDIFMAARLNLREALANVLPTCGVDACDRNKVTLLHYAASGLATDVVNLLLESGADATLEDAFGRRASDMPLESQAARGVQMARRLRPICYPEVFQDLSVG